MYTNHLDEADSSFMSDHLGYPATFSTNDDATGLPCSFTWNAHEELVEDLRLFSHSIGEDYSTFIQHSQENARDLATTPAKILCSLPCDFVRFPKSPELSEVVEDEENRCPVVSISPSDKAKDYQTPQQIFVNHQTPDKLESATMSVTSTPGQSSSVDEIRLKLDSYKGKFGDFGEVSKFTQLLIKYRTLTHCQTSTLPSIEHRAVRSEEAEDIPAEHISLRPLKDEMLTEPVCPLLSPVEDHLPTMTTHDIFSTRSRKRSRSLKGRRRRGGSSPSIEGRVFCQSSQDGLIFEQNVGLMKNIPKISKSSGVNKKKRHGKRLKSHTTLPFVMDFLKRSQRELPKETEQEGMRLEQDWDAFLSKYKKDTIPSAVYRRSGIQTIHPKCHMLDDFEKFVAFTYYLGCSRAGACRIIPPADWSPQPGGCTKLFRRGSPDEKLENVNFKITDIYSKYQNLVTSKIVDVRYSSRKAKMTIVEFYDYLDEKNLLKSNVTFDQFKKELFDHVRNSSNKNSTPYGKDLHCSLFSPDVKFLNVNNLDSFMTRHGPFDLTDPEDGRGLRSAYMYIGCKGSFFVPHVEDYFFFSLNYHHAGHSKFWRIVPPSSMYRMARCLKTTLDKEIEGTGGCYLSPFHKSLEVEDSTLVENRVPFQWIEQVAGSFILTYPKAYHSGFSNGMNIGEAANFAFSKDWAKLALTFPVCKRCPDSANCDLFSYAKEALTPEEFTAWEIGELEVNGIMVGRYVENGYNNKDTED